MNINHYFFLVFCITAMASLQLQAVNKLPIDSVMKERMPEFPGGQLALFQFIKDNIGYTPKVIKKECEAPFM